MPVYIPPGRGGSTTGGVSGNFVNLLTDQSISGKKTFNDDVTFNGTVLSDLNIEDNTIVLNYGETGAGVTVGYSGILIDRGTETDATFRFKENSLANDNDNRWVIDIGDGTEEKVLYDNIPDDVTLNGKLTVNNDLDVNFDLTITSLAGNTDEIVTLDATGQLVASGLTIADISGGSGSVDLSSLDTRYVNISGDTMTGELVITPLGLTGDEIVTVASDGTLQNSGLTISDISGNNFNLEVSSISGSNVVYNQFTNIDTIRFDYDSGLDVVNLSGGVIKVQQLNSTFKFWEVSGQDTIVADGLDTIEIVGGNGLQILTDDTLKSVTFNVTGDYASSSDVTNLQTQIDDNDTDIINIQSDVSDLQTQTSTLSANQNNFVQKTGDTMTGSLTVDSSNVEITGGQLHINESSITSDIKTGVGVNTVIDSISVDSGNASFWDVLIYDGTNFRASKIISVWDNNDPANVRFNEVSSENIGDTSGIELNVSYNSSTSSIRLKASPSVGTWNVKFIRKLL